MARAAGNSDETTDPTNTDDDDEQGTSAADAFEAELTETIGAALEDDDEQEGAGEEEDPLDIDVDDEDDDDGDEDDEKDGGADSAAGNDAAKDDRPRDAEGKFVAKDAKDAAAGDGTKPEGDAAAPVDGKKPDAAAAAAADTAAPAKAAEPTWEPLSVKAGNETVTIDEAKISRFNGHLWAVVPEKQANRFLQRISRGAEYERVSRQLDRDRREFESLKNAPAPKSDAQIEAEIFLEVAKPYLKEMFDETQLQVFELKIENAKMKARTEHAAAEQARVAKAAETPWEEQQVDLLDDVIQGMLKHPELAGLPADVVDEIKEKEFLPVKNALIFQDNGQPVGNTQFIFERLKRARASAGSAAPASPAASTADTTKPASSQTSAKADTSLSTATKKPADQAERFNRGADAAAKPAAPSSTSVKANRTTRPAKSAPRAEKAAAGRTSRDDRAAAEDKVRSTDRKFLNAPGFDFDDDEDDED